MILNDRTTFRIGRVGGLLLLLVAISILPLAARVRAEDESEPENAAARRPDAEQDAPESAGRTLDVGWHADVRKSSDCIQCHDFSLPAHHEHGVGKALHDFDHQLGQFELLLRKRVEYFRSKKRGARDLERMEKLLDSMNRMLELERATQGLKNLGFDDALIEALIQDRARAKSAEEALKKILKLTNEGQAEPETDETSLLDLRYTGGLRMPAHPMLAQERARIERYLQNAEGHAEAETDEAGQE